MDETLATKLTELIVYECGVGGTVKELYRYCERRLKQTASKDGKRYWKKQMQSLNQYRLD